MLKCVQENQRNHLTYTKAWELEFQTWEFDFKPGNVYFQAQELDFKAWEFYFQARELEIILM